MLILLAVVFIAVLLSGVVAVFTVSLRRPTKGVELIDYSYWDSASELVDQPIYGDEQKPVVWEDHFRQWDDII